LHGVAEKGIVSLTFDQVFKKSKFQIVSLYLLYFCTTFDLLFAEPSLDDEVEVVAFMQVFKTHCAL